MSRRRLTTVVSLSFCLMIAVWCRADEKAFADAQTEYATVAREARNRFAETIRAELKQSEARKDAAQVRQAQEHLAEVLLSWSDQPKSDDGLGPDIQQANAEYLGTTRAAQERLVEAYRQRLSELPVTAVKEREVLEDELAQVTSGARVPSVREFPAAQEFTVLNWVSEKKLFAPLNSDLIPDEFDVVWSGQNFRIFGTAQHDRARIQGQTCGHFGKVVLFDRRPAAFWKQTGFLRVQTSGGDIRYGMVVVADGKAQTTPFSLTAGKSYEWSAVVSRRRLTFAVKDFEAPVAEFQAPDSRDLRIGFFAQARTVGEKVDLTVSYEDTSVVKQPAR